MLINWPLELEKRSTRGPPKNALGPPWGDWLPTSSPRSAAQLATTEIRCKQRSLLDSKVFTSVSYK